MNGATDAFADRLTAVTERLNSKSESDNIAGALDLNALLTSVSENELTSARLFVSKQAADEKIMTLVESINKVIVKLIKSNLPREKRSGIMAILAVVNADINHPLPRVSRFANYLRNQCLANCSLDRQSMVRLAELTFCGRFSGGTMLQTQSFLTTIRSALSGRQRGTEDDYLSSPIMTPRITEEIKSVRLGVKTLTRLAQIFSRNDFMLRFIKQAVKVSYESLLIQPVEPVIYEPSGKVEDESVTIRRESNRYVGLVFIRDVVISLPTFFYQNIAPIFSPVILQNCSHNANPLIRQMLADALRAILRLTAERELSCLATSGHDHVQWYNSLTHHAYKAWPRSWYVVEDGGNDAHAYEHRWRRTSSITRTTSAATATATTSSRRLDGKKAVLDGVHGNLLLINETVVISNARWERQEMMVEDVLLYHFDFVINSWANISHLVFAYQSNDDDSTTAHAKHHSHDGRRPSSRKMLSEKLTDDVDSRIPREWLGRPFQHSHHGRRHTTVKADLYLRVLRNKWAKNKRYRLFGSVASDVAAAAATDIDDVDDSEDHEATQQMCADVVDVLHALGRWQPTRGTTITSAATAIAVATPVVDIPLVGSQMMANKLATDFTRITDTVIRPVVRIYREYGSVLIKDALLTLLPRLAAFRPRDFVESGQLRFVMKNLLDPLLDDTQNRSMTLICIGRLSIAIHSASDLQPFLEKTLACIQTIIYQFVSSVAAAAAAARASSSVPLLPTTMADGDGSSSGDATTPASGAYVAALATMAFLVQGLGGRAMHQPIHHALSLLLDRQRCKRPPADQSRSVRWMTPFNHHLVAFLRCLMAPPVINGRINETTGKDADQLPDPNLPVELRRMVLERLLAILTDCLICQSVTVDTGDVDEDTVILSLQCLSLFSFDLFALLPIVDECSRRYLFQHATPNTSIRLAAVVSLVRMLSTGQCGRQQRTGNATNSTFAAAAAARRGQPLDVGAPPPPPSSHASSLPDVARLVQRLVICGVTDRRAVVRTAVFVGLLSLPPTLRHCLAQAETLSFLLRARQDRLAHIREDATTLMCHLARLNQTAIVPALCSILNHSRGALWRSAPRAAVAFASADAWLFSKCDTAVSAWSLSERDHACRIIRSMAVTVPHLIRPHYEVLMAQLMPYLIHLGQRYSSRLPASATMSPTSSLPGGSTAIDEADAMMSASDVDHVGHIIGMSSASPMPAFDVSLLLETVSQLVHVGLASVHPPTRRFSHALHLTSLLTEMVQCTLSGQVHATSMAKKMTILTALARSLDGGCAVFATSRGASLLSDAADGRRSGCGGGIAAAAAKAKVAASQQSVSVHAMFPGLLTSLVDSLSAMDAPPVVGLDDAAVDALMRFMTGLSPSGSRDRLSNVTTGGGGGGCRQRDQLSHASAGLVSTALRLQIVRILGLLGAPDVFTHEVGAADGHARLQQTHVRQICRHRQRQWHRQRNSVSAVAATPTATASTTTTGATAHVDSSGNTVAAVAATFGHPCDNVNGLTLTVASSGDGRPNQYPLVLPRIEDLSSIYGRREDRDTVDAMLLESEMLGLAAAAMRRDDVAATTSSVLIPVFDSLTELESSWQLSANDLQVAMAHNRLTAGKTISQFYASLAIAVLVRIIRHPSLAELHKEAISAVTYICYTLGGAAMDEHVAQVVPSFVVALRAAAIGQHAALLGELCQLLAIVGPYVARYADSLFVLIDQLWSRPDYTPHHRMLLVTALHRLSRHLDGPFRAYVHRFVPHFVAMTLPRIAVCGVVGGSDGSDFDASARHRVEAQVFAAQLALLELLQSLAQMLTSSYHMLIPRIVALLTAPDVNVCDASATAATSALRVQLKLKRQALTTLSVFSIYYDDVAEFSAPIIHSILTTIERASRRMDATSPTPSARSSSDSASLTSTAMDALALVFSQLSHRAAVAHLPYVHTVVSRHVRLADHVKYSIVYARLVDEWRRFQATGVTLHLKPDDHAPPDRRLAATWNSTATSAAAALPTANDSLTSVHAAYTASLQRIYTQRSINIRTEEEMQRRQLRTYYAQWSRRRDVADGRFTYPTPTTAVLPPSAADDPTVLSTGGWRDEAVIALLNDTAAAAANASGANHTTTTLLLNASSSTTSTAAATGGQQRQNAAEQQTSTAGGGKSDLNDDCSGESGNNGNALYLKRLDMDNLMGLRQAWIVTRRASREDWLDWANRLCIEFIKSSPASAVRACSALAQKHSPLTRDLFNAAFLSCWKQLDASMQNELIQSLEQALTVPELPELSQMVLNLDEFIEHCDTNVQLPISSTLLGDQAFRCRAFAKSLHYKERDFGGEVDVFTDRRAQRVSTVVVAWSSASIDNCTMSTLTETNAAFEKSATANSVVAQRAYNAKLARARIASAHRLMPLIESLIAVNNRLGNTDSAHALVNWARRRIDCMWSDGAPPFDFHPIDLPPDSPLAYMRNTALLTAAATSSSSSTSVAGVGNVAVVLQRQTSSASASQSQPQPPEDASAITHAITTLRQAVTERYERWYENLHDWDNAFNVYRAKMERQKLENHSTGTIVVDSNTLLGQMRCLRGLGQWQQLHSLAQTAWTSTINSSAVDATTSAAMSAANANPTERVVGASTASGSAFATMSDLFDNHTSFSSLSSTSATGGATKNSGTVHSFRAEMASIAATAAWEQRDWPLLAQFVDVLPRESVNTSVYKAVVHIVNKRWHEARAAVLIGRHWLDKELSVVSLESYQRAQPTLVRAQVLTELEEVIELKMLAESSGGAVAAAASASNAAADGGGVAAGRAGLAATHAATADRSVELGRTERIEVIRAAWARRMQHADRQYEQWQSILRVRSLAVAPAAEPAAYLKFASLCRSTGRHDLAKRTILQVMGLSERPANATRAPSHAEEVFDLLMHRHKSPYYYYVGNSRVAAATTAAAAASSLSDSAAAAFASGGSGGDSGHVLSLSSQPPQATPSPAEMTRGLTLLPTMQPLATYALCKHIWEAECRQTAFYQLRMFVVNHLHPTTAKLISDINAISLTLRGPPAVTAALTTTASSSSAAASTIVSDTSSSLSVTTAASGTAAAAHATPTSATASSAITTTAADYNQFVILRQRYDALMRLLARCFHKLGCWEEMLNGGLHHESTISQILQYYSLATENDSTWYKAWHSWAVLNYEAVLFYRQNRTRTPSGASDISGGSGGGGAGGNSGTRQRSSGGHAPLSDVLITRYAVPAMKGFLKSVSLATDARRRPGSGGPNDHQLCNKKQNSTLQDMLRLLTLFFEYGDQPEMYDALHDNLRRITAETWLQVVPQLIARIDTPRPLVARLLQQILLELGRTHPQALVYSLSVALKSPTPARYTAANKIWHKIRDHNSELMSQASVVSDELIRIAILWHEQWHDGLEEASRLYFGDKNIPAMLAVLEPLHATFDAGPETMHENAFHRAYVADLAEAKRWCYQYKQTNNEAFLNQAWDHYYNVFRRISQHMPRLTQIDLKSVSARLAQFTDLVLAVPGSYTPHAPLIRIAKIHSDITVITSKQRPRKLSIRGSDGQMYMFLLKGHEDLRQDERVMQFFTLVNSLLFNDRTTSRQNLAIQQMAVVPLSTNSGLIGWIPDTDTLHSLIKQYRDKRLILINLEHRIMIKLSSDIDHLPLMKKVEIFEFCLNNTDGDDLARILRLRSPTSEAWLERRTNYIRSLAVMSMVGHVLGLGDRHPSNLLLDRISGKMLHIDFGDCFEIAMTRDKFPERVPFRLTRMLVKAMEVTGIDGMFRSTSQAVMAVLRNNKDSLMAVLEAFVHDPLLNWRLVTDTTATRRRQSDVTVAPLGAAKNGGVGDFGSGTGTDNDNMVNVKAGLETVDCGGGAVAAADVLNGGSGATAAVPGRRRQSSRQAAATAAAAAAAAAAAHGGHCPPLNAKAIEVVDRVNAKLTGNDFATPEPLGVVDQVDLLIEHATSNENLCQSYTGWCPFW